MIFEIFLAFALVVCMVSFWRTADTAWLFAAIIGPLLLWAVCFISNGLAVKQDFLIPIKSPITGEIKSFQLTQCNKIIIPEWATPSKYYHKGSDEYEFLIKKAENDSP